MIVGMSQFEEVKPAHLDPVFLSVLFAGGVAGTLLRAIAEDAFKHGSSQWPWPTFLINLSGALVLGFLLEMLSGFGADEGRRKLIRVGFGSGLIGSYTTYSTFAVEVLGLARSGAFVVAFGYAVISVVLGVATAALGMVAARQFHRRFVR